MEITEEHKRLQQCDERLAHWKRWGPFVSERAWGTVREDYSADGCAWDFFPHDHARSKAYRWNEDGIAGFSDRRQHICFAIALWNEQDAILKERMFGLTGSQGNHGEDVKEYYYYLDSTPTHSYAKCLYKYPMAAYPYQRLIDENAARNKFEAEFELIDTGIFEENRYFDVFVEYAKDTCDDILIKITIENRSDADAPLHLLPTVWFRNTWSWTEKAPRPHLERSPQASQAIELTDLYYGRYRLYYETAADLLFTENETNNQHLYGTENASPYVKDAFDRYVIHGETDAVNPAEKGTKAACHYKTTVPAKGNVVYRLRLAHEAVTNPFMGFDEIIETRQSESDQFYDTVIPASLTPDSKSVMRQAFAGMMWCKQFYHYVIKDWLDGDPTFPKPPASRLTGRNSGWLHVFNDDVLSMPDSWEYPWYAAWDLAFHCIPISLIDSGFAKDQLILLLREWYMHPNGQLPAYEWAFGDVNPPVHAWSAWRVYRIEGTRTGRFDVLFLERAFQKLMLNFTWWVNRKDREGNNVFEGGFLGLDNIGIFDRSAPLPTGGYIEQSDGTSWMGMYTLNMLAIAMELASHDRAYQDIASKFWEHFLYIANAMNGMGAGHDDPSKGWSLWNEEDGFYYDVLHLPDNQRIPLKVRSVVGIIPLFAVETLEPDQLQRMSAFRKRMNWFIANRPDLTKNVASMVEKGKGERILLSIPNHDQLRSMLSYLFDEEEFLSPYGIRSVSKFHDANPFVLKINGNSYGINYEPAESTTGCSEETLNWRGPIWMPINFLIIESLQKYHYYYGDDFQIEFPTGSGHMMNLWDISQELSRRLSHLFLQDEETGRRPVHGGVDKFQSDPNFKDYVWFYEYFHGDNGAGIGASHQTGWTGLGREADAAERGLADLFMPTGDIQTTRFCSKCLISREAKSQDVCENCGGELLAFFDSEGAISGDYLTARGYCCGNGCSNCPYPREGVYKVETPGSAKTKTCGRCGADFECHGGGCWCGSISLSRATLAQLKQRYDDCLCPKCLDDLSD